MSLSNSPVRLVAPLVMLIALLAWMAHANADIAPGGDAAHGAVLYQACMACHSLDEDDVGPRHRGVFGRLAGTVPGYAYSPGLRNSHIVWNQESLDRWLTNPQALVPGAKMFFAMPNPKDRADVIAYLSTQK
jgi:cytochrome c